MMHVGCGSDLLPETGSVVRASHEPLLSPTSADYTRGQATFAPLRGYTDASLKPYETLRPSPPLFAGRA
jgi:hypothetical protein